MTDPDTTTSVQGDTPSGQEPATPQYSAETGSTPQAPDPQRDTQRSGARPDGSVKAAGAGSSAEKDSDAWVTGDEPMTGPQASYLETLAQQAGEEPPTGLTKAQAHDEIERLQSGGSGGTSSPGSGATSSPGSGDGADGGSTPRNQERPTTQWVTGDEPMTGPQASYLETLAQQAGEEPPTGLNKSEASRAIDDLRSRAGQTG
jgi:hypothetical protein